MQYLTKVSCKDLMQNTEIHTEERSTETRTNCKVRLLGSEKQPIYIPKMTKRALLFRLQLSFVSASSKLNQRERKGSSGKGAILARRQAN